MSKYTNQQYIFIHLEGTLWLLTALTLIMSYYRSYSKHKDKIQELMNDKFEDFHNGNKRAEDNLKRLNDQKTRAFFFNKNQRDT